jgi:antitoxin (DNA-binding transcriptional repressor) of toxin-antitoxin stability system
VPAVPVTLAAFGNGNEAPLVNAGIDPDPGRLLTELGLDTDRFRSVVVVFGGADTLHGERYRRAVSVVGPGVVQAAGVAGAAIIDGGTAAGVMAILGEAVAELQVERPLLLGVAPAALVALPGKDADDGRASLEPNHSHFVLASGAEWGDETALLFHIAEVLAGAGPVASLLVGGGEVAKSEALRAVRRGWPLLVVERTGGVADLVAARRRAIRRARSGWFALRLRPRASSRSAEAAHNSDLDEISTAGSVRLFEGEHAAVLARELAWELQDERALKRAWRAFARFDALANQARTTFKSFQASIIVLGVGGTLLALLDHATDPGGWPGDVMHWTVVALPVLVSLLIALAIRYGFGKRWVLLRAAAEVVKSEIYRFRTRQGVYAEAQLGEAGLSREEALAIRTNAVQEKLVQTEAGSWPLTPYEGRLPPDMYGASADDDGLSPLEPDRYLALRIGDQLNYFHPKVVSLARQLRVLLLVAMAAGAAGTLVAAAGFEVWIGLTTAITAAAVAYLSYLQVEPTLVAYNQAATKLEGLRRIWEGQPAAKRDFDHLVAEAEGVLATELSGWVQQMNQAIAEAAERAEAETDARRTVAAPSPVEGRALG